VRVDRVHGLEEGWAAPLAAFSATAPTACRFPPPDHVTLTLNRDRGPARRDSGPFGAGPERLSLDPPGLPSLWRFGAGARLVHVYLPRAALEAARPRAPGAEADAIGPNTGCLAVEAGGLAEEVLSYVACAEDPARAADAAEMDARALRIARRLVERRAGPPPAAPAGRRLTGRQRAAALGLIEARIDERLMLADLAAACGMTRFAFARAFRATFGLPPHRYVLERRVGRALALLSEPARPLAEIALVVGFSSQAHMTDTFRRIAGVSPGRARAALLAGRAADPRAAPPPSPRRAALAPPPSCGCRCDAAA
jgi:AraC family transcriptional regulator